MEFEMNNRNWKIIELSQEDIREKFKKYKYDGEPQEGRYFGLTYTDSQVIYIDKDLHIQQKRQTLLHELMHCYIDCYLFNSRKGYDEEDVCNISSNSHQIIHKIVEKYFKEKYNCG